MKTTTKWCSISTLIAVMLLIVSGTLSAQDMSFRDRALRWGVGIGYNFNEASLGYQNLHEPFPNFAKPDTDTEKLNGDGNGIYAGIMIEYLSKSWWGVQIRASYDVRNATVQDIYATPTTEFITRMNYLTFEPALRIDQHLIPNLNFNAGPLIAANLSGNYDYKADVDGPVTDADLNIPDRSVVSLGATFGIAYDLEISRGQNQSVFLSPFFDYSWIAAQRKAVSTDVQNSVQDIWSTQSFRAGIRLSWETRKPDQQTTAFVEPNLSPLGTIPVKSSENNRFYIILPANNMITHKSVTGYFPVHPYVFFDRNSQEIPSRYAKLSTAEARQFSTDDLGNFSKENNSEKQININRLMEVYYHVLNIYGDRMRDNPTTRVTLRSSDPQDREALTSANAIKSYLVNTFGIASDRISIAVEEPWSPSGSVGTDPNYKAMIDDENRRVKMVFSDPDMYRAIPYTITDRHPIENDMFVNIQNDVRFRSWSVAVTGENQTMNAGPFSARTAAIDLSSIMSKLDEGEYKATVTIDLVDGRTVTEFVDFKVYRSDIEKNATRYLMLFDYNESRSIWVYEDILREEIIPGISSGNAVYVHGHTDIIGNAKGNQKLSQARADEIKDIILGELEGTSVDVNTVAIGIGQQKMQYTFDNSLPEGRLYNRNVFVEVVK